MADQLLAAHQASRSVLSSLDVQTGWTIATQAFQSSLEDGADEMLRSIAYPAEEWYLEAASSDDFVGVQAYTRNIVGPEGIRPPADTVEKTLTGWEFYPPAAGIGVRAAWELSSHTPVMVTENGIATDDDSRRIAYTEGALRGLHACISDGINLLGYQHWSALDNYEWASGFGPTFGLIGWDRETFERTPKPSSRWYGEVARAGQLETTN